MELNLINLTLLSGTYNKYFQRQKRREEEEGVPLSYTLKCTNPVNNCVTFFFLKYY